MNDLPVPSNPPLPNRERLRLHIPPHRPQPGGHADFGYFRVPAAGVVARPAIDVPSVVTHPLATALIRVLDEENRAVGEWDPGLDPETLRQGLRWMMLTRAYDERMYRAQRTGKTSFYMTSRGEEAVAVAQAMALRPDDMLFTSYRQQGLLIARNYPLIDMMCQIYSNGRDPLKGRQLPVMYSSRAHSFFSISGNLATQLPQAVGWAMASAYAGDSRIAAGWIGEGATAEADFHHALTFAAVYRAPVVLNVVNNQWAISSHQEVAGGEEATFAARAIGFGLACLRVDGNDFLATYAATRWAAERARANHGATLIELFTYRAGSHSTSDDPTKYRPEDEPRTWPLGDPVERLARHLIGLGEWSEERHKAQQEELARLVRDTDREAQSHGTLGEGPHFGVETMFEDVFKDMPWNLRRQQREAEEP
ncbi:MAG TPA: thiamine pyrophosphate-dependent dehydrogenase E1 component subunit alpha [Stellaceae bacterium]|jgi:2-oxoisovalerate dehydrogenase E1 component alpha subunit|nr:thiamine pyrophosphate-dependent dehydrogenase E1 component subunit alpha [Stellaceae bacterium]